MKKPLLLLFFSLLLSTGCAMRHVTCKDEAFLSTKNPALAINIHDATIKFIDRKNSTSASPFIEIKGSSMVSHESYLYAALDNIKLKRALLVNFYKSNEGSFIINEFARIPNKVTHAIKEIGTTKVPMSIFPTKLKIHPAFHTLAEKFYMPEGWYMTYGLSQSYGARSQKGWVILYAEPVPPLTTDWQEPSEYNEEHRTWIKGFKQRAEKAFSITL